MADNKDKLTIQDYVDYFGDKSAMSDDVLDQLFGTIKSRGDYMESQRGQAMSPEMMQLIMGAVEPGGGIKAVGKAAARGGKNILDILRELFGRGRPEMGDVLAGLKRRSQPSEYTPSIIEKPLGQQELFSQEPVKQAVRRALQLPKQEVGTNLPAIQRQMVPRTFQQRQDAFIDDLLNRVYGTPSPRSMNPKAAEIFEDNMYNLRSRVNRASTIGTPTVEQSIDDFIRAGKAFKRSNRVSPKQRATKEIDRNRNMIKNIGDSIGKDTGKGYKEVDIQDLIDFLSGKN